MATAVVREHLSNGQHRHLLCWKSIIGGVLIALMGMLLSTSLGAAIAGFTAENLINRETGGSTFASASGLWLGISTIASLFCGGYFATRVSSYSTNRVGAAQGFVVASIFFILMVVGASNVVSGTASGISKIAHTAGLGASGTIQSPEVQDALNKAIGTGNLKSDPKDVAQGLSVRLMQGDFDSAKSYLAYQTGQSEADVDAKINQLKSDFESAVKKAGEKTAHAVGDSGVILCVLFLLGLIAAVLGGRIGAHANVNRPLVA